MFEDIFGFNCTRINMVQNGIDPNKFSSIQRLSHLEIPIKYQYLHGITILTPTNKFFETIVDVHQ